MKPRSRPTHSLSVEQVLVAPWKPSDDASARAPDFVSVYRDHADFVYRSLQHLGVREADLEDVVQEVFLVVHRRLDTYDGISRLTTWLFGICLRLASRYHRRSRLWRRRSTVDEPSCDESGSPESACSARQARALLDRALSRLSLEHRAVFVLYEIEGQSGPDIAEVLGIPVGTVHSRLHDARKRVLRALERIERHSGLRGRP